MSWTEYELEETGVKVRGKDINGIHETSVDYDRIGKEASYFMVYSAKAQLAVVVFLILTIFCVVLFALHESAEAFSGVFWLAFAAFAFGYYQNTKREGYRLESDYGVVTLFGKKVEVAAFVDSLVRKKGIFIEANIKQRLEIMERAEVEKYLLVLREGRVLSQTQYDIIRVRAGLEKTHRANVGFAS